MYISSGVYDWLCGLDQAREEAIAKGEDPDAAEALILNGGVPPAAAVEAQPMQQQQQQQPPPPQPQSTGLEGGGAGLGIEADVRDAPFGPFRTVTVFWGNRYVGFL